MADNLKYIFCGDDFTGASDTLATLARAGLRCRLFLNPENLLQCPDLEEFDAVGIATALRALPPEEMISTLQQLKGLFTRFRPQVFHYKICSTFDSSPLVGSIGTAIKTIHTFTPESNILISGGQPSLRRYCTFSNLFAAAADGAIHRIDKHPTMAHHPVTPMSKADLRSLLSDQGLDSIEAVHYPEYKEGIGVLIPRIDELWQTSSPVLFDVHDGADLEIIGQLIHRSYSAPLFAIGSSSIAEAYLSNLPASTTGKGLRSRSVPENPILIIAGSRSPVTASQVANSNDFKSVAISPRLIEENEGEYLRSLTESCKAHLMAGQHVLAVVEAEMDHSLTRHEIADFTARFAATLASVNSIHRLCIAGGDTSSLALQSLNIESLSYVADIEPGLCLCRLHSNTDKNVDGLEVVLKGGQMGSPQLFNALREPL